MIVVFVAIECCASVRAGAAPSNRHAQQCHPRIRTHRDPHETSVPRQQPAARTECETVGAALATPNRVRLEMMYAGGAIRVALVD